MENIFLITFEDNIRLGFLIVSAVIYNIAYYSSAPPGHSRFFYLMGFRQTVKFLTIFIVAQVVFNVLLSVVYSLFS